MPKSMKICHEEKLETFNQHSHEMFYQRRFQRKHTFTR